MALVLGCEGQTANSKSGTRGYWAPEVVRRQPYRFEVDWFSLGATVYALLSMHSPFSLEFHLERRPIAFEGLDATQPGMSSVDEQPNAAAMSEKVKSIALRQRHGWHAQLVLEFDPPCVHPPVSPASDPQITDHPLRPHLSNAPPRAA